MPSVFTALPVGSVVRLNDEVRTATVGFIEVNGQGPFATFIQDSAIITGWSVEEGVNVQFTHTMGDDIYMNVFGNRIGHMTIEGISFNAVNCDASQHGIVSIINYFRTNRISSNSQPITITIGGQGGITIKGALISASYNSKDPENWMVQYVLTVATVPR